MLSLIVLSLLLTFSATDAGTSYIRWGRTTCPTGSLSLYKGYMAGPYYAVGGSGSNFLCMDEKPQFVRPVAGRQDPTGYILGVEFENAYSGSGSFLPDNLNGGALHNQNMPCVRCYVQGSSDQIMLPGRQDCGTTGYDLMYKGFLVSEWHGPRGRSSFVCMDEAPEGVTGGTADNNEAVVYPVQVACGTLPCNPYVDGYEATCAVCTY